MFLASTGAGDAGYELQILDSYDNKTYVNGQAGSIYKQYIPLVNASRKPGEWQTYDVIWTAPTFNADGSLKTPAYVTAFHNGVLVQNHVELKGETRLHRQAGIQEIRPGAPIKLQAHGDPSAADQLPQYLGAGALGGCRCRATGLGALKGAAPSASSPRPLERYFYPSLQPD